MKHGPCQRVGFPGHAVILVKTLADDQSQMQVNMNQPAARLVIAEITQDCRVVPHRDGRKQLEPVLDQDRLRPVLIVPCNEKVEVCFAGQHRLNALAAFPVAVGKRLPMKVAERCQQQRERRLVEGQPDDRARILLKGGVSHHREASAFDCLGAPAPVAGFAFRPPLRLQISESAVEIRNPAGAVAVPTSPERDGFLS